MESAGHGSIPMVCPIGMRVEDSQLPATKMAGKLVDSRIN
jgi:hypothetical protein